MRDNVKGEVNIEMPTLCQHTYEININFRYKIIRTYFESWNRCRYEEAFENLINIVRLTFHKCKVSRHSMTLHNVINTNIILLSKRNRTFNVRCMLHALISCIDILFDDCDMLHFQRYTDFKIIVFSTLFLCCENVGKFEATLIHSCSTLHPIFSVETTC